MCACVRGSYLLTVITTKTTGSSHLYHKTFQSWRIQCAPLIASGIGRNRADEMWLPVSFVWETAADGVLGTKDIPAEAGILVPMLKVISGSIFFAAIPDKVEEEEVAHTTKTEKTEDGGGKTTTTTTTTTHRTRGEHFLWRHCMTSSNEMSIDNFATWRNCVYCNLSRRKTGQITVTASLFIFQLHSLPSEFC